MSFFPSTQSVAAVRLPWGAVIEVNANEGIGRELARQSIFDIAVSETAWRILKTGDVAVDVGANVGYMTSLFSAKVRAPGRVESFEPHPRIFARLRQNIQSLRESGSSNIRIHEVALGSRDGAGFLIEPPIFGINEGASTVAPEDSDAEFGRRNRFEIGIARFDSLFADCKISLLKVDVEGFEAQVLAGAECSLARGTIQNVIYEAHDCERSPLHQILADHGYSIYGIGHNFFGPRLTRGADAPRVDRGWESPSYLATLTPESMLADLQTPGWRVLRGK